MKKRLSTDFIILHCSATEHDKDIGASTIKDWHLAEGWSDIGYHYVIRLDGTIERGRDLWRQGSHCKGHNYHSVGVCFVGGLVKGSPSNTLTEAQKRSGRSLVLSLMDTYPNATVRTHRSFSPDLNGDGVITKDEWMKECPCFEVDDLFNDGVDTSTMIDL